MAFPCKTYGALAAGVPVVFIGAPHGETAELLSSAECGVAVRNGSELARSIVELRDNPTHLGQLATNARAVARERFDRERSLTAYAELIDRLAAQV